MQLPLLHDFTGRLNGGWLFVWRCPARRVRRLLPPGLELVEHRGHAFWNIVAGRVTGLRPTVWPAGLPWPGAAFWQISYRLMVRHRGADGHTTEGLYFVRSECDDPWVVRGGNLLTDFHYHPATVCCQHDDRWAYLRVNGEEDWAEAVLDAGLPPRLAAGSPFATLEEAAGFLEYRPVAISPRPDGSARTVRVQREDAAWQPHLCQPVDQRWPRLEPYGAEPELCFELPAVGYRWHLGVRLDGARRQVAPARPEPEKVLAVRSVPT